jgi:hypothetical protein
MNKRSSGLASTFSVSFGTWIFGFPRNNGKKEKKKKGKKK